MSLIIGPFTVEGTTVRVDPDHPEYEECKQELLDDAKSLPHGTTRMLLMTLYGGLPD